jgi:hypothetical protein
MLDWIIMLGLPLLAFLHCLLISHMLKRIMTLEDVVIDLIKQKDERARQILND